MFKKVDQTPRDERNKDDHDLSDDACHSPGGVPDDLDSLSPHSPGASDPPSPLAPDSPLVLGSPPGESTHDSNAPPAPDSPPIPAPPAPDPPPASESRQTYSIGWSFMSVV